MALTLPASMQEIVGNRFLRLGTSTDNTKFFIDIPRAFVNSRRSRYGYILTDGVVLGSSNLPPLLGAVVLSVYLVAGSPEYPAKIVFTSNPTGSKLESSIIFVDYQISLADTFYLQTEDGFDLLQENGDSIILDDGSSIADTTLTDSTINKNLYSSTNSETKFFVIQEDDF
jgi:hypothetical protein